MTGKCRQHVVEKADPRLGLGSTFTVEIEGEADLRLPRLDRSLVATRSVAIARTQLPSAFDSPKRLSIASACAGSPSSCAKALPSSPIAATAPGESATTLERRTKSYTPSGEEKPPSRLWEGRDRARDVVAEGHRRPRPEKDRSGVTHLTEDRPWISHHELQVLGSDKVAPTRSPRQGRDRRSPSPSGRATP